MTRLADHASFSRTVTRQVERQLKITVLSGGPSSEREVSLKSGRAVAQALSSLGHQIHCADISPDDLSALDHACDLVFVALHGAFGEDGRLQQLLEERHIRYCGSGPVASARAMDKVAAKRRFVEAEVPTPRFDVVTPDRVDRVANAWTLPVVVKPVADGSSVDVEIVQTPERFVALLRSLTRTHGRCLIEQYVKGPELTVGILGDEALPPIEIRTQREFYDYQAKYVDEDTQYLFDIDLPEPVLEQVRSLSLRAHQALGCRHFSRVDWMVDGQTHQPYALEVNTIPGFTDHSLLPKAAARAGLSFAALCNRIVELALAR